MAAGALGAAGERAAARATAGRQGGTGAVTALAPAVAAGPAQGLTCRSSGVALTCALVSASIVLHVTQDGCGMVVL